MLPPSGFHEITRKVSVTYPVPFAFATCLAFAVLCLAGSLYAGGALRWVFVGFAIVAMFAGLAGFAFAMLMRPELLRSERHVLAERILQMAEDSDLSEATLEAVSRYALTYPRLRKKGDAPAPTGPSEEQDDG